VRKNAISILENGSCGGWRSFEGVLRKRCFVVPGYKENETGLPFFRNLKQAHP
jgi:hypothetical protein